jgi:hypothetical protein
VVRVVGMVRPGTIDATGSGWGESKELLFS